MSFSNNDYVSSDGRPEGVVEGMIDVSKEGHLCVVVKLYGSLIWQPIQHVSGSMWVKIREQVARSSSKQFMNKEKRDKVKRMKETTDEVKSLFYKIFNKMSVEEKKTFLEAHPKSWLMKIHCSACMNITESTKTKCIHHGCPGMCDKCYSEFSKRDGCNCPSCNKPQVLVCPCCQEDKNPSQLVHASGGCGHAVCWSCYGRSFHAKKPIYSCPMCRGEFIQRNEDDYLFSDSEDDDDDNSDIDGDLREDEWLRDMLREETSGESNDSSGWIPTQAREEDIMAILTSLPTE